MEWKNIGIHGLKILYENIGIPGGMTDKYVYYYGHVNYYVLCQWHSYNFLSVIYLFNGIEAWSS